MVLQRRHGLGNVLLRRVLRHTRVSTLFRRFDSERIFAPDDLGRSNVGRSDYSVGSQVVKATLATPSEAMRWGYTTPGPVAGLPASVEARPLLSPPAGPRPAVTELGETAQAHLSEAEKRAPAAQPAHPVVSEAGRQPIPSLSRKLQDSGTPPAAAHGRTPAQPPAAVRPERRPPASVPEARPSPPPASQVGPSPEKPAGPKVSPPSPPQSTSTISDSDWRRLETIFRKHQERERLESATQQAGTQSTEPSATSQAPEKPETAAIGGEAMPAPVAETPLVQKIPADVPEETAHSAPVTRSEESTGVTISTRIPTVEAPPEVIQQAGSKARQTEVAVSSSGTPTRTEEHPAEIKAEPKLKPPLLQRLQGIFRRGGQPAPVSQAAYPPVQRTVSSQKPPEPPGEGAQPAAIDLQPSPQPASPAQPPQTQEASRVSSVEDLVSGSFIEGDTTSQEPSTIQQTSGKPPERHGEAASVLPDQPQPILPPDIAPETEQPPQVPHDGLTAAAPQSGQIQRFEQAPEGRGGFEVSPGISDEIQVLQRAAQMGAGKPAAKKGPVESRLEPPGTEPGISTRKPPESPAPIIPQLSEIQPALEDQLPVEPSSHEKGAGQSLLESYLESRPPLEAVWPVERREPLAPQMPSSVRVSQAVGPEAAPAKELPEMTHHEIQRVLQTVAPGQPTDSSVEMVIPRRPRPAALTSAPSVERSSLKPAEEKAGAEENTAPSTGIPRLPPSSPKVPQGDLPVESRAVSEVVPTEIGPLPADLWRLIGEAPPEPEMAEHKEKPARLPDKGQALPGAPAEPAVQRQAAEPSSPAQTPSPSTASPAAPQAEGEGKGEKLDVDELSRRVYREVKRRLAVEWERIRR